MHSPPRRREARDAARRRARTRVRIVRVRASRDESVKKMLSWKR